MSSSVSEFIDGVQLTQIREIKIYAMRNEKELCLYSKNVGTISIVLKALKNYKKVDFTSVIPQSHDQFFLIDIYSKNNVYEEIEIVSALGGEGIMQAHTGVFYIRNDGLLKMLNSLCDK